MSTAINATRSGGGRVLELSRARETVGSLVRFDGFQITVGLQNDGCELVLCGTPRTVHAALLEAPDTSRVTVFFSELAAAPRPSSSLRRAGWWG